MPPPGTTALAGDFSVLGDTAETTDTGMTAIVERRLTPRQRRRRMAVIAGCILLLLAVVGGAANVWGRAARSLRQLTISPTATVAIAPGADLLYVDVDVASTSVTVDGTPVLTPVPEVAPPLRLSPGHHVIGWRADHFTPQECSLTVPPAASDTCPASMEGTLTLSGQPPVRVLLARESISTVQLDQRDLLLTAIAGAVNALGSTTTIQPGEPYLADGTVSTATAPIMAQLAYKVTIDLNNIDVNDRGHGPCDPALNPPDAPCIPNPEICTGLCTVPWSVRPGSGAVRGGSDWYVLAVFYPNWTYFGPTLASNQALSQDSGVNQQLTLLHISFDAAAQTWEVTPYFDTAGMPLRIGNDIVGTNPTCVALRAALVGQSPAAARPGTIRYIPAPNPADGCVADVNGPVGSPTALFIYRFGIVLAANDQAHVLGPTLPLAGDYARQLAQQISVLPGGWTA
jgi:hypothetical protein